MRGYFRRYFNRDQEKLADSIGCQHPLCSIFTTRDNLIMTCDNGHLICPSHVVPWKKEVNCVDFKSVQDFYNDLRRCSREMKRELPTIALLRYHEYLISHHKLDVIRDSLSNDFIKCCCCEMSDCTSYYQIKNIHKQLERKLWNLRPPKTPLSIRIFKALVPRRIRYGGQGVLIGGKETENMASELIQV